MYASNIRKGLTKGHFLSLSRRYHGITGFSPDVTYDIPPNMSYSSINLAHKPTVTYPCAAHCCCESAASRFPENRDRRKDSSRGKHPSDFARDVDGAISSPAHRHRVQRIISSKQCAGEVRRLESRNISSSRRELPCHVSFRSLGHRTWPSGCVLSAAAPSFPSHLPLILCALPLLLASSHPPPPPPPNLRPAPSLPSLCLLPSSSSSHPFSAPLLVFLLSPLHLVLLSSFIPPPLLPPASPSSFSSALILLLLSLFCCSFPRP